MSDKKKTIQINPELFRMSGSKTKKNRNDKPISVITPNNLKNKLLGRIKEHKNNEIKEASLEKKEQEYSDEFYGALGYLSDLSKKHKKDADKDKYERSILEKRNLHQKTVKNYDWNNSPHVELELPPELREPIKMPIYGDPINLKYNIDSEVPHGCLRGGQKPTFRSWQNQTRKNTENISILSPEITVKPINSLAISREEKLEMIKNKLKNLETVKSVTEFHNPTNIVANIIPSENEISIPEKEPVLSEIKPKKYVKTTIRRKYTLGKSNIYRKVGVLIKDKQTRKKILNAHKELKKTSINDIKKYLHKQGIMKVGASAPNDILRKTYESSKLAGEITNTNKEILLHNYLNSEESKLTS